MNLFFFRLLLLIGMVTLCSFYWNIKEIPLLKPQPPQTEEVINYARQHLPQKGVLKEQHDGFVYLKVDDDYIYQLFPLIKSPEYLMPAYFRRKDSPGAHISVFYIDERKQTGPISEVGMTYTFTLLETGFVPLKTQEYIVLKVDSPQLQELRVKYGLSPLLKDHDFHITIAKKKKVKKHPWQF